MTDSGRAAVLVAVMAAVTILLRFLPFLIFRRRTPAFVSYLGKVLPAAIIGMLVVYCLKDENLLARPYGLPALIAAACTAALQRWKRSSLLSILAGTGAYMLLIRLL